MGGSSSYPFLLVCSYLCDPMSSSPNSHCPRRKSWVTCQAQVIAATLFAGLQTLPIASVLAAGPAPGTTIQNQATGSFVDTKDGSLENIESNIVQVTVAEVAGVTVTPAGLVEAPTAVSGAGPTQGNGNFDPEDVVYFIYEITNVGNDPTQFFIPGTASSIVNGSQFGQIEIIEIDSDGPGPIPTTDLSATPVPIQTAGNNTGDTISPGQPLVLGLPQGSLPPDGTLKVRIPIKFNAGLNPGDQVTAVLGDTPGNDNSASTQNQVYSANGSNGDLYTQDNQDGDGIANETPGMPANGDSTSHRQEASARLQATVGDSDSTVHTISGVLFLDNDGNDALGSEPGVPNVTVHLYEDLNNDGILDVNDDQNGDGILDGNDSIASDVTDSSGAYSFQALDGNYLIQPDINDPDIVNYAYGGVINTANDPLNNPRNVDVNGADVTTGLDFPYDLGSNLKDYGDAPDTGTGTATGNYQTLNADGGPSHNIDASILLGPGVTPDADGFVDGTDTNGNASDDTDDGVLLGGNSLQGQNLVPGSTSILNLTTSGNGELNAWIDWNQDGDFTDTGEQIATNVTPTSNAIALSVTVPNTATLGNTYARFRYSTDTSLGPTGAASDGEVEDYAVEIAPNPPPLTSCPVDSLLPAQTVLDFQNPTPETGTVNGNYSVGATYRFANVATNIDAVVEVIALNNATIVQLDQSTTGLASAFQPEILSNSTNAGQYSIDMQIRFVDTGTNTPANLNTVLATAVDVDGDSTVVREFVELSGNVPVSYTIDTPSNLTASQPNGTTVNFESQTSLVNPGINLTPSNIGSVEYGSANTFDYRFGLIIGNNAPANIANQRLGSLYFDCVDYNTPNSISPLDYGDAPDTYGTDVTASNSGNGSDPVGASHAIVNGIHLGAIAPDAETDASTPLDGSGDGAEDDGITLATLQESDTTYTIPAGDITATGTGTLHAWVDFDKSGTFEPSEYTSIGVTGGTPAGDLVWNGIIAGAAGDTYARFRFTTDSSISASTPGGTASDGEVEDYKLPISSPVSNNPNVLLVKRITAVNGSTNHDGINLQAYDPDIAFPYDDNVLDPAATPADTDKWPVTVGETSSNYLLGARDAGVTRPDDEVEYTIYFLSTGDTDAYNVQLCDKVPDFQTFVPDAFNLETPAPNGGAGANRGITVDINGVRTAHTNDADGDLAQYYPPGSTLPTACNGTAAQTEDNGAIVVNLGTIPKATSAGTPLNSFGFIRFRAKVK